MRHPTAVILLLAGAGLGCAGAAGWKTVSYPDPQVSCPGGRAAWNLQILDRRANRSDEERAVSILRESLADSFPGCQWAADGNPARIQVEIHRFATAQRGNFWEARAGWTVLATDSDGRKLTEFEVDEEVSRPNYRGSNNARESLREAFDRALRRTLEGLRSISLAGNRCPPQRSVCRDDSQTGPQGLSPNALI
jgi:hypothetical protein